MDAEMNARVKKTDINKVKVVIKGRSSQEYEDLLLVASMFLKDYYPTWLNSKTVSILPRVSWIAYDRIKYGKKLDSAPDALVKGDNAELMVARSLYRYGEINKEPMFLVAKLEFDAENKAKKILDVLQTFLPPEKVEKLKALPRKLELDLVIVHDYIGTFLVQVKDADNPENRIQEAEKNLHDGEIFMHLFCPDNYPLYKIVFFPNAASSPSKTTMENLNKRNIIFMNSTDETSFKKLFNDLRQLSLDRIPYLSHNRDLLHWMIALKSIVTSTISDDLLRKVTIDTRQVDFRIQSKETDQRIVEHNVFTGKQLRSGTVRRLHVANQVLFLNPQQLAIWEGPRQQVLQGFAGTGKTVLLQFMALTKAKEGERSCVITTKNISTKYEQFFKLNDVADKIRVISNWDVFDYSDMSILSEEISDLHVFIDETQQLLVDEVIRDLQQRENSAKYLWIAFDPYQHSLISGFPRDEHLFKNMIKSPLEFVMRCSPEIIQFWSKHLPTGTNVECNEGNRLFTHDILIYQTSSFNDALNTAHELVTTIVDNKNVMPCDCALILHDSLVEKDNDRAWKQLLNKFQMENEKAQFFAEKKGHVPIVRKNPCDIWSLEWTFLFILATHDYTFKWTSDLSILLSGKEDFESNTSFYTAASRCKVQLFLITVTCNEKRKAACMTTAPQSVHYQLH